MLYPLVAVPCKGGYGNHILGIPYLPEGYQTRAVRFFYYLWHMYLRNIF